MPKLVTDPDAQGHFGPYGGMYVPETLVPACEELGVSTRQLRRWKDAVKEHGEQEAFPGHGKGRDTEVAKLRRELKKVTEERDFLKEAARYFARESEWDTLISTDAADNIPSG